MPWFDIFRKKKKPEKKIEEKRGIEKKPLEKKEKVGIKPKKEEKKKTAGVESVAHRPAERAKKKKISDKAYKILHSPHITEKATDLEKENKYVFKIWPRSNKIEVKEAVESIYGVEVEDVKIINIHRRRRRLGRHRGWKKGYKKAIVKIKQGQKIEILPR